MFRGKLYASVLLLIVVHALSLARAESQSAPVQIEGWNISALDLVIADTVAKASKPGASDEDRLAAAAAYLKRAKFFYGAGRAPLYKLALGDARRVLRLQPANTEAREMVETISSIYQSLDRPIPQNGTEGDVYNDPSVRYTFKPEKVSLPPDKNSISFTETLPAGVIYVYEVKLRAGQRISMNIKSDNDAARFNVLQGREDVSWYETRGAKMWDAAAAPEERNFLIKISSSKVNTTYILEVDIR